MKGCHNCPHSKKLSGKDYQGSPCESCRARHDPPLLSMERLEEDVMSCKEELFAVPAEVDLPEAERESVLGAMARCVVDLVGLFEENPLTFRITMAKIKQPCLSYSDIAAMFKCKKQNVQYHLEKAVKICPNLRGAILVDRRFSRKKEEPLKMPLPPDLAQAS